MSTSWVALRETIIIAIINNKSIAIINDKSIIAIINNKSIIALTIIIAIVNNSNSYNNSYC